MYTPVLKWKTGELSAYTKLADSIRDNVTPLFEVPPASPLKNADITGNAQNDRATRLKNWLVKFGKDYKKFIGNKACFIDATSLLSADEDEYALNGQRPLEFIFDQLRTEALPAIPVASFDQNVETIDLLKRIQDADKSGICIRVGLEQLIDPNITSSLKDLLTRTDTKQKYADLIIDFKKINLITGYDKMILSCLKKIPLKGWRSLALVATSFPASMAEVEKPHKLIPRLEWTGYKSLMGILPEDVRPPSFGDYAIRPPGYENKLWITPIPNKLVYTVNDNWFIYRGKKNNRDGGLAEYSSICKFVVGSDFFMGADYSNGDACIEECSRRPKSASNAGIGGPQQWIERGTNHHITKVVNDLSSLFAS